ncbi:MAG: hypothetical protein HOV79_21085 [Hamadaea sp.]|nr:hypothetical protein [Hamadaea sp.]
MRLAGRLLATALAALALTATSACGVETPVATPWPAVTASPTVAADPTTPASPIASTTPGISSSPAGSAGRTLSPACAAVMKARQTALDAISPVSAVLVQTNLFHDDLAEATRDLMAALTALHAATGSAAELTSDTQLRAKISAYQLSVEQAIVAVESSDSEQAKLKAVIASPAMRTAEKAVVTACS